MLIDSYTFTWCIMIIHWGTSTFLVVAFWWRFMRLISYILWKMPIIDTMGMYRWNGWIIGFPDDSTNRGWWSGDSWWFMEWLGAIKHGRLDASGSPMGHLPRVHLPSDLGGITPCELGRFYQRALESDKTDSLFSGTWGWIDTPGQLPPFHDFFLRMTIQESPNHPIYFDVKRSGWVRALTARWGGLRQARGYARAIRDVPQPEENFNSQALFLA